MNDKNKDSTKLFTRRAFVIGGLQASLLAVLGGRLAYLQVSQGQKYQTLAEKNRISIKMLPPSRGEIFDRFGRPLAMNTQNFRVLVTPEQTDDIKASLTALGRLISLSDKTKTRVIEDVKRSPKFATIEIKDDLSWEDVARIEVNLPDLPGLSIDVGEIRSYPLRYASAHLVGYVSAVSHDEIKKDPDHVMLTLPGFKTGKTGMEGALEKDLRGKAGAAEVEVNVIGREVRELGRKASQHGENYALSIDAQLQSYTQQRLASEKSASAVIMDAHTGAVYALASHPSFDPNDSTRGLSRDTWQGLLENPAHPLNNKAIAGQYPPASTFKMITALAGMQTGHIKRDTVVYCPGHYEYGKDRFHCWKRVGHGWTDVVSALSESCDVFFYKLATEIGIDAIAETARDFGLGQRYNFDLRGEGAGLIPDKNWKLANFGARWQPGESIVASIGQGYMQATPLQLAVMTARLINGGKAIDPWLHEEAQQKWSKIDVNPAHLALVKRGMDEAVNHKKGTAYDSRIEEDAIAFGGKTGTAQVKRITMEQREAGIKNEELEWRSRHHALFVGYAPLINPRYVASVVVEHGIGGSRTAAPIAKDLLLKVQQRRLSGTKIQRRNA